MPSLTWCTHFSCLITLQYGLGQNSTKPNICIWGVSGIVVRCFRPHLTLTRSVVYIFFTLLPCLTTFNIDVYITERELNNSCGVLSICNSLHIELHLICSIVCCTLPCFTMLLKWTCIILDCASCHVYAWLFTMLFAPFWCCFFLWVLVTSRVWGFVRLRLLVFFMDSFFFLAGSQARWPYSRNHFYLCLLVVRSIAMSRYLPLAISCLPYCHVKPLTHLS